METGAVLRVKRKRGGPLPAEALILACKRFRVEAGAAAEASSAAALSSSAGEGEVEKTLFKLVATVNSEAEPVDKYVQEAFSQQKGSQILRPALGSAKRIIQDLRSSKQAKRQESRYRLVTSLRPNLTDGANEKESDEKEQSSMSEKDQNDGNSGCCRDFQFFDIVQEEDVENDTPASHLQKSHPDVILCNAVEMIREHLTLSDNHKEAEDCLNQEEYVYDIYCMETAALGWIENILSVQPYTQEFYLGDEEQFPEEIYEDEDDENNENNWRNDYPDENEFLDEDEESEKISGDTSDDDDCGYIRPSWEKYKSEVLQEFEYDGIKELDSE